MVTCLLAFPLSTIPPVLSVSIYLCLPPILFVAKDQHTMMLEAAKGEAASLDKERKERERQTRRCDEISPNIFLLGLFLFCLLGVFTHAAFLPRSFSLLKHTLPGFDEERAAADSRANWGSAVSARRHERRMNSKRTKREVVEKIDHLLTAAIDSFLPASILIPYCFSRVSLLMISPDG